MRKTIKINFHVYQSQLLNNSQIIPFDYQYQYDCQMVFFLEDVHISLFIHTNQLKMDCKSSNLFAIMNGARLVGIRSFDVFPISQNRSFFPPLLVFFLLCKFK